MSETAFQKTVVEHLRHALHPDVAWHHSPNEGRHKVQYRVKQKAMGMCPGWPDLEFMFKGQAFFIELKLPGETLSENQIVCHRMLADSRCPVVTCFSLDEVIGRLKAWDLIPSLGVRAA